LSGPLERELAALGWTAALAADLAARGDAELLPARVFGERRGVFTVRGTGGGEQQAVVAGRLRHRTSAGELPVVGDWVAVRAPGATSGAAVIQAVLARRTVIARKVAGDRPDPQVLAANVDVVVVMMGLDGDYNLRRLERYLAVAGAGGAEAIVLLTKADLVPEPEARLQAVREHARDVPAAAVALPEGRALPAQLEDRLGLGRTLVLLGSSGVGKSTLLNRLAGGELQRTAAVRGSDSRGRHTTTYRQMFALPAGAMVIDTPGLREIQLYGSGASGEDGVEQSFPDVAALAGRCRFRDCAHAGEPGCALPAAVAAGEISPARLAGFQRLRAEQEQREQAPRARRRRR
jgi:ribosome biogenesis GTPase / thiamine phosphate phosphatase